MRNVLVLSLLFAAAFGQSADAPMKLGDVTVTGTFRTRVYGWDWDAELATPFLLGLPDNANAHALDLKGGFQPKVLKRSSEFHALRLSNAHDLWYGGAESFSPGPSAIAQGLAAMEQNYPNWKSGGFG